MAIIGFLATHQRNPILTDAYSKHRARGQMQLRDDSGIQRHDVVYKVCDLPVCRSFFLFVNGIGLRRYKQLRKHFDASGVAPRVHRSIGMKSVRKNVLSQEDTDRVVQFIEAHAEKNALPLPGRVAGLYVTDCRVVLLPARDSKERLYRKYVSTITKLDAENVRIVSSRSFRKTWQRECSHIRISKPATDLCNTCRENTSLILKSADVLDEEDVEKNAAIAAAQEHLNQARIQREHYNEWRTRARTQSTIDINGTERSFAVLSFDFAEQIHYPSRARTVGPEYFKTARKCGIFGVHDERTGVQTNYLLDEADQVGKGANVVISLLHHYFSTIDADVLVLFADNCCGQNKNNAVLHYILWRVATNMNVDIQLNFMLAGHTKFGPDRNFGILKFHYKRSDVDCLQQFIECVKASSVNGFNTAIATILNGERVVIWRKWNTFLSQAFSPFVGILRYHHFYAREDGTMDVKLFADSAVVQVQLTRGSPPNPNVDDIEVLEPEGLSPERQWYLFDSIRSFCSVEENMDLVAPQPTVPRPRKSAPPGPSTAGQPCQSSLTKQPSTSRKVAPKKKDAAEGQTRKRTASSSANPRPKKRLRASPSSSEFSETTSETDSDSPSAYAVRSNARGRGRGRGRAKSGRGTAKRVATVPVVPAPPTVKRPRGRPKKVN